MTLLNDQEKLSIIADAFPVAVDPLADGNRAANARQTIRDVLAGVEVHVVSAGTYAARCDERDAARARLADVEASHARRLSLANDEALAVDAHVRDLEGHLARVKAEAEGLRRELADTLAASADLAALRAASKEFKRLGGVLVSPIDTESP